MPERQCQHRVSEVLKTFYRKHGLPDEPGTVHDLPWEQLCEQTFRPEAH